MFHLQRVSILTRPEGRVQRTAVGSWTASQHGFQSSPVPKDGCNPVLATQPVLVPRFNPHPSRRTGATERRRRERCFPIVSILTRPEGRVQHRRCERPPLGFGVSILTRPEGRVQLSLICIAYLGLQFQSSPVPKDGCNLAVHARELRRERVSILTRPEGRVQPFNPYDSNMGLAVSILTRPEGRVQREGEAAVLAPARSFNPHPSRRSGATPYNRTKFNTAVELSRPTTVLNGAADDFHPHYTAFLRICQVIWLTSMPANLTLGA